MGGVLFVGGAALAIACTDLFIRHGRGAPFELDAPRHLVTTGPFAVGRNPIDMGEQAVIWGAALYLSSVGPLVYVTVLTVCCFEVYVEEPELRERFGDEYEDYRHSVPRWLPRVRARVGRLQTHTTL